MREVALWVWWAAGLSASTLLGVVLVRKGRELGFTVLVAIFGCYVLSANLLAPRLAELGVGWGAVVLPTGSVIWPFTSQLSDMINEVYGRRRALIAVVLAYCVNVLFLACVFLGAQMSPLWSPVQERFWLEYFLPAPRILVASGLTFLIVQGFDVFLFSRLKMWFQRLGEGESAGRIVAFCFARSATSDSVSMLLDGALFALLAFSGTVSGAVLTQLILGSMAAKILLAIMDTPFFIGFRLGVRGVRREN